MAELATTGTPGDYRLGFAGDTFNTAWYLACLRPDAVVCYCTAVGTDTLSGGMRAAFVAAGIDDAHVRALPDRTAGLYLIALENGERIFSYWRGQSAARHLADDPEELARAMDAADLVYFSGMTLAILAPAARETLLEALRSRAVPEACEALREHLIALSDRAVVRIATIRDAFCDTPLAYLEPIEMSI